MSHAAPTVDAPRSTSTGRVWFVVNAVVAWFGLAAQFVISATGMYPTTQTVLSQLGPGNPSGVAGALLTQTNQFVGLNVLGFEPSGELLVMLVLGGVGRLYGAFVGPLVYMIAQDQLARQFPEYWYLGIGLILVLVVMFARGGILGMIDGLIARFRRPA